MGLMGSNKHRKVQLFTATEKQEKLTLANSNHEVFSQFHWQSHFERLRMAQFKLIWLVTQMGWSHTIPCTIPVPTLVSGESSCRHPRTTSLKRDVMTLRRVRHQSSHHFADVIFEAPLGRFTRAVQQVYNTIQYSLFVCRMSLACSHWTHTIITNLPYNSFT